MVLSLFVLLNFCVFSICQQDPSFGKLEIVSDMLPKDCFDLQLDYEEKSTYGLPECVTPFSQTKKCNTFFDPQKNYGYMPYKPTGCAKDGSFGPIQCKGERTTGRCFCFNQDGKRIFGQQWWAQAADMTCECSRKKANMADLIYYNSLHCNSMGNFEQLQCDVVSEQCWCADEQTGDLTSPVVPSVAMFKLPCYDVNHVGTQYLRKCDNQKYAQKTTEYKLNLHGTVAKFGDFLCDEDGAFGAYTVIDGSAYCTWRDNSKIGSWQSGDDRSGVNCNCARDSRIFSLAGKVQNLKCILNGNYKSFQTSGTKNYCVDSDGYRISPSSATINEEDDCKNYKSYNEM